MNRQKANEQLGSRTNLSHQTFRQRKLLSQPITDV